MPNTTDVLDILTNQHSEVDELITKLESGRGDRTELFNELADKLAAHAEVEEKLFYPAAMSKGTSEILLESVEEHLSVKRLLADMLELDPDEDADEFDAKLSVLKEQLEHHAHEEEEEILFPKVRKLLDADQRAALGNEVLVMFADLVEQAPRDSVAGQTDHAAALPMP